jgi:hypothetical protein
MIQCTDQVHQLFCYVLIGGLQIPDNVPDELFVLLRHEGVRRSLDTSTTWTIGKN